MKLKILFAIIFTAVFCVAGTALAMTEQERQTLIAQIQAQIAQLTQQLNQMLAEQQGTETWCHSFNIDLDTGDTGSEVAALQTALIKEGFTIASSESSSQQFGATTGQAVKDFKVKYSSQIATSGTTKVADRTRGMLNQLYGCTTQPACAPYWYCGSWSECTDSQQIRTCTDSNSCGVTTNKPSETQGCTITCTADCTNETCGADDGCGGICQTGTCPTGGMTCTNGQCVCSSHITASWGCTVWSTCTNGQQTRNCSLPLGACYQASTVKPSETQSCGSSCTPSWSCGSWSTCTNSQQTRNCYDSNYCGVTTNKPAITQSCTDVINTPTKAVTLDLKINGGYGRAYIKSGESATITWTSTNANSCLASNGWSGSKTLSGSETINTVNSKTLFDATYDLTCSNSSGFRKNTVYLRAWACTPSWYCTGWSACTNNNQTRTCSDRNSCGVLTNKPVETKGFCDFQSGTESCVSKWECSGWSSCASFKQTRTCTDSNNCGLTGHRPVEKRFCYISENSADYLISINNSYSSNLIFTKTIPQPSASIKCGSWSPCLSTSVVNSDGTILAHQNKVCYDENYTYSTQNPTEDQEQNCTYNNYSFGGSGECVPQFSCTDWSPCSLFKQHRKCYDKNYCPNKNYAAIIWPVEERFCMCPNVDVPASFFQCLSAQLPAKAFDERASISSSQYKNSSVLLTSIIANREDCGCGWYCPAIDVDCQKITSCSTGPKCSPNKVPETLTRTRFYDSCFFAEINYVEWSSWISKGESIEQAKKHTAEDQKRISAIQAELECRKVNMKTY